MININTYPPEIVPAGNLAILDITGDNMYSQNGTAGYFFVNFVIGETLTEDDTFTLSWGEESLTFLFKASPDDSGLQYALPAGAIDEDYIWAFVEFLGNNYLVNRDFVRTGIRFDMRTVGDYQIAVSDNSAPNVLSFLIFQGTEQIKRNNYQLLCSVYDHADHLLGQDAINPDATGRAVFDASEYLTSQLELQRESHFSYPWPGGLFQKHATHPLRFRLKYAEKWEGSVKKVYAGSMRTALLAGFPASKLLNPPDLSWMFLTNTPSEKKVTANCPERLFYFNDATRTVNIMTKKYFKSGNALTVEVGNELLLANTIYEINADILNSVIPESGETVKYDIWLSLPDGTQVSEIKTYILDFRHYRNTDYFFFRNSLGAYDLLRCTGRRTNEQLVEREVFEDENRNRIQYYNVLDETFTANTGSISHDMEKWLDDFIISLEVYWLRNGVVTPVIVSNKKKARTSDDQYRFNLEFDFSIAKKEAYA